MRGRKSRFDNCCGHWTKGRCKNWSPARSKLASGHHVRDVSLVSNKLCRCTIDMAELHSLPSSFDRRKRLSYSLFQKVRRAVVLSGVTCSKGYTMK